MKRYFMAFMAGVALTALLFASPGGGRKEMTVGDFAVKISRAMGFAAPDQSAAVESLTAIGVDLGGDPDARLTERVASDILGDLGVRTTTDHPESVVSTTKADSLATMVALSSLQGLSTESFPPPPTQCLQFKRAKCVECCKKAIRVKGDPALSGGSLSKICDRFCKTGEFPSPSEPGF